MADAWIGDHLKGVYRVVGSLSFPFPDLHTERFLFYLAIPTPIFPFLGSLGSARYISGAHDLASVDGDCGRTCLSTPRSVDRDSWYALGGG